MLNSRFDLIKNCKFLNIPGGENLEDYKPVGIYADNAGGADIINNEFQGSGLGVEYGLVICQSGFNGTNILENEFNGTHIGHQFEGFNQLLKASCNDYTSIDNHAWTVLDLNGSASLGDQGVQAPNGKKADNEFFDTCEGFYSHIKSEIAFNYYDRLTNVNRPNPNCVSPIVNYDDSSNSPETNCAGPSEPPCNFPPCDEVKIFEDSDRSTFARNIGIQRLLHPGWNEQADEENTIRYGDVKAILQMSGTTDDLIMLAGNDYSKSDYIAAQSTLSNISEKDELQTDAKNFLQALVLTNSDLYSYSKIELANLETLTYPNLASSAALRSILALSNNEYSLFKAQDLPTETKATMIHNSDRILTSSELVYPNPFKYYVDLDLTAEVSASKFELSDLQGRIIRNISVANNIKQRILLDELEKGMYFYSIRDKDQNILSSGKLNKL